MHAETTNFGVSVEALFKTTALAKQVQGMHKKNA
jgi:hypothetical protein